MEGVEFFVINGQTFYSKGGITETLTEQDREAVSFMLDRIATFFPDAYSNLQEWAKASIHNRRYYEFRMVDRFIRCNFGEADFQRPDIENGLFNFEEVKCPLRNICEYEGHICKPRLKASLTQEEQRVVSLYVRGYQYEEMASELGKSESTCKKQILSACRRLKLPHPRRLFRIFGLYNITM